MNEIMMSELMNRVLILPPLFRHQLFDRLYLRAITEEEKKKKMSDYGDKIKYHLKMHGLDSVSDWTGRKQVDSSVIVAYENSAALKEEFEINFEDKDGDGVDDRLVFFTRILSISKLCDDNFSPTHIFWLVRASRYFPDPPRTSRNNAKVKEDKAVSVAYHFSHFSSVAIFSNKQMFKIAEDVYQQLEQDETNMLIQMYHNLQEGVEHVDATLFSQAVIAEYEDDGKEVLKRFLKRKKVDSKDQEIFSNLRLFFRKWISEAFVGCLSHNGASLVWDFLFLHKFSMAMTANVCLMLVHLLKPLLDQATSYR